MTRWLAALVLPLVLLAGPIAAFAGARCAPRAARGRCCCPPRETPPDRVAQRCCCQAERASRSAPAPSVAPESPRELAPLALPAAPAPELPYLSRVVAVARGGAPPGPPLVLRKHAFLL